MADEIPTGDIIGGYETNYIDDTVMREAEDFPPELVKAVQLGVDAERFMTKSKIGVYLYNRALSQITEATSGLSRMRGIRNRDAEELHDDLRVAQLFLDWMNDALEAGRRAEEQLQEEEDGQERIRSEIG